MADSLKREELHSQIMITYGKLCAEATAHLRDDAVSMQSLKSAMRRSLEAVESKRIIKVSLRRIVTASETSAGQGISSFDARRDMICHRKAPAWKEFESGSGVVPGLESRQRSLR